MPKITSRLFNTHTATPSIVNDHCRRQLKNTFNLSGRQSQLHSAKEYSPHTNFVHTTLPSLSQTSIPCLPSQPPMPSHSSKRTLNDEAWTIILNDEAWVGEKLSETLSSNILLSDVLEPDPPKLNTEKEHEIQDLLSSEYEPLFSIPDLLKTLNNNPPEKPGSDLDVNLRGNAETLFKQTQLTLTLSLNPPDEDEQSLPGMFANNLFHFNAEDNITSQFSNLHTQHSMNKNINQYSDFHKEASLKTKIDSKNLRKMTVQRYDAKKKHILKEKRAFWDSLTSKNDQEAKDILYNDAYRKFSEILVEKTISVNPALPNDPEKLKNRDRVRKQRLKTKSEKESAEKIQIFFQKKQDLKQSENFIEFNKLSVTEQLNYFGLLN